MTQPKKAIHSFRLRLHSSLRQSGNAQCAGFFGRTEVRPFRSLPHEATPQCAGLPVFLLGVVETGKLEHRVMRLLDERMPWARRGRFIATAVCVVVLGAASVGVGIFGVRTSLAQTSGIVMQTHAFGDIAGDWQGVLASKNGSTREILRISRMADGVWKAILYNADESTSPVEAISTTLEGLAFKCQLPGARADYAGKLSGDGNTLIGSWKPDGEPPVKMDLIRATRETAWGIPSDSPIRKPMATDVNPSFAASTIKPSDPNVRDNELKMEGSKFAERNHSLADLISWAYGMHKTQVIGDAEWLDKKYDITAVQDGEGNPSARQWKIMMQKLLVERFRLSFHRDKRQLPVYVLSLQKEGPTNLPKSADTDDTSHAIEQVGPGKITLTIENSTIADFAFRELQSHFLKERPVLDQTGLAGRFDFQLIFAPDPSSGEAQFGGPPKPDDYPSPDLFIALQKELGLKLETVKALADVMVIDHVERPMEN